VYCSSQENSGAFMKGSGKGIGGMSTAWIYGAKCQIL
jgi:hypothetical protein